MTKIAKTLGDVYIYMCIVSFNKKVYVNIEIKLCFLDVQKMSKRHSFFEIFSIYESSTLNKHKKGEN